jgi:hypothetical protein
MGMYDYLRCHYPLPVQGANARNYQTKNTPCRCLNKYEITADGVLRHRPWDADEKMDNNWIEHPDFIGEVRFYGYKGCGGWIEFSTYVVNGVLKELHLVSNTDGPNVRGNAHLTAAQEGDDEKE